MLDIERAEERLFIRMRTGGIDLPTFFVDEYQIWPPKPRNITLPVRIGITGKINATLKDTYTYSFITLPSATLARNSAPKVLKKFTEVYLTTSNDHEFFQNFWS